MPGAPFAPSLLGDLLTAKEPQEVCAVIFAMMFWEALGELGL